MVNKEDSARSYHLQCTGHALDTAKAHSSEEHITLFGSCFCPFVQRVWVTLEHLGFDYMVGHSIIELNSSDTHSVRSQYCRFSSPCPAFINGLFAFAFGRVLLLISQRYRLDAYLQMK